ncbi:MAG: hypothetical protein QNJ84_15710 [Alphaproteobacteria bacterium]|nr:hypothetical protein [Alphaproteobacteria bacterium]
MDFGSQTIIDLDGEEISFGLSAFRKHCPLDVLDDIGLTLRKSGKIDTFAGGQATS